MIIEEELHPKVWEKLYQLNLEELIETLLNVLDSYHIPYDKRERILVKAMGGEVFETERGFKYKILLKNNETETISP